ncbi:MAG TPA: glycogen debranching protein GlgX [Terrimicrobiaceae bacterium]
MDTPPYKTSLGEPYPLGATVLKEGVNFSLFSQHATSVQLLLFQHFFEPAPLQVIDLHPVLNKTFHYWHVFVEGARHGLLYAYRLDGPNDLGQGFRFNQNKVLIDPYSRGVVYGRNWRRDRACDASENFESAMKSLVVDSSSYDWEGTEAPNHHLSDYVIYETHVRGFTKHPSSGVAHPGTFSGLIEKIPYLKELGINCVELMPVHQFDATESRSTHPETHEKLTNYWGYDSICFFAPHRGYYIADWENMEELTGFRDLVKALHKAGIEVILDVVFNHTGESDEAGPTICMRGIDNSVYYMLDPSDRSRYLNYTGCGNTVNCNHPAVRRMILECLRFWVGVMRVDGFRFDLASILSRDESGRPMQNPPLLWEIESDPVLHKAKIFAEAWDAAGLYQVGGFPGERWAEWNGRYRDDVRRFVRGDQGMTGAVASRMAGSADLYQHLARAPYQSINFVTCHDGFTLNDLVSYNEKHNLENGEGNRDGSNENLSWNHGVEGPTDDPAVEALRLRQIKNFVAILLLSQGTPMLLAGDEMRRTQRGNNNAYCQDNEISWHDWTLPEKHREVFRFVRLMIQFRQNHAALRRRQYYWGETDRHGRPEVTWHGIRLHQPDWSYTSHAFAFTLSGFDSDADLHLMISAYTGPLRFELPPPHHGYGWFRCLDTSLPSPLDIADEGQELAVHAEGYDVAPRSVAVLIAKPA